MRFVNHWNPVNGTGITSDLKMFTQAVESRFNLHIEAAYQGKQYLVQVTDPNRPFDPAAAAMMTPVCNLSTGETSTNHLGQSCGASTCKLEGVCAVCGSPTCPFWLAGQRATALKDLPETCEKERAWKRGAFIQEAVVAKNGLVQQWLAQNDVWISPRCNSALWTQGSSIVGDWWAVVAKWQNVGPGQFDNCNIDPTQNYSQTPVQAPCYLVAASEMLNFALAEAAVCEIFTRAESRWLTHDEPLLEDSAAYFRDAVLQTCQASTPNRSQLVKCANTDYTTGIQSTMKAAVPQDSEYAWAPAPDPVYTPPGNPPKPINGLLQCPTGAKDCPACMGDAVACPEAGQAFVNAELGAIVQVHADLLASSADIDTASTYFSVVPAYTPSPTPLPNPSGLGMPSVPSPGGIPGPTGPTGPSPTPTSTLAAPSPTPTAAPTSVVTGVPNVTVITFPGVKP